MGKITWFVLSNLSTYFTSKWLIQNSKISDWSQFFFLGEYDRSTDLSYFPELPPLREYNSLLKTEFSELQDLGISKNKKNKNKFSQWKIVFWFLLIFGFFQFVNSGGTVIVPHLTQEKAEKYKYHYCKQVCTGRDPETGKKIMGKKKHKNISGQRNFFLYIWIFVFLFFFLLHETCSMCFSWFVWSTKMITIGIFGHDSTSFGSIGMWKHF